MDGKIQLEGGGGNAPGHIVMIAYPDAQLLDIAGRLQLCPKSIARFGA